MLWAKGSVAGINPTSEALPKAHAKDRLDKPPDELPDVYNCHCGGVFGTYYRRPQATAETQAGAQIKSQSLHELDVPPG